jgi:hypothetical protein
MPTAYLTIATVVLVFLTIRDVVEGNRLLFPDKPEKDYLFSRNRLGGLLKYYQRAA